METIYCTLDAKRLTFWDAAGRKASGGETACYAVAPRPRTAPRPSGKVLNLDDYRTRAAGRPAACPVPPEKSPAPAERASRPKVRRRLSVSLAVDLLASAAVVALLAAVVMQLAAL